MTDKENVVENLGFLQRIVLKTDMTQPELIEWYNYLHRAIIQVRIHDIHSLLKRMCAVYSPGRVVIYDNFKQTPGSFTGIVENDDSQTISEDIVDEQPDNISHTLDTIVDDWYKDKDNEISFRNFKIIQVTGIINFIHLVVFDLSYNQIESLPDMYLPNVKRIRLSNNSLSKLPKIYAPKLSYFVVSNNIINDIRFNTDVDFNNGIDFNINNDSADIINSSSIEYLDMSNNPINKLPAKISMPTINILLINNININELSANLYMPKLECLMMNNNNISSLPDKINLPSLMLLNAIGNQFHSFPYKKFPRLRLVNLDNNPFDDPADNNRKMYEHICHISRIENMKKLWHKYYPYVIPAIVILIPIFVSTINTSNLLK